MFGYDWPRLHAAPQRSAVRAADRRRLLRSLAAAARREGLRDAPGRFWTLMLGDDRRGAGGRLGTSGREPHRPRGGGAPADGAPRAARAHHRRHLRRAGALAALPRVADGERRADGGAGPVARRASACSSPRASQGGRLVFEHAADPDEVLQADCRTARRAATTTAASGDGDAARARRRARASRTGRRGGLRGCDRFGRTGPATSIHPGTTPHSRRARRRPALTCSSFRLALAVALTGCRPDTTRPSIAPVPEAASTEIRLVPQEATSRLAEAMVADSIPRWRGSRPATGTSRVAGSTRRPGAPTRRWPLGTSVVRVRAWADPGRPGISMLIVETVYRPMADPSTPERELERQVPRTIRSR